MFRELVLSIIFYRLELKKLSGGLLHLHGIPQNRILIMVIYLGNFKKMVVVIKIVKQNKAQIILLAHMRLGQK